MPSDPAFSAKILAHAKNLASIFILSSLEMKYGWEIQLFRRFSLIFQIRPIIFVGEMRDYEAKLHGRTILVVEDDAGVRGSLIAALTEAGANVIEAADGLRCLEHARQFKPDLITLDLVLPDRAEVDVFCELRDSAETSEIPVCIVTGYPEYRRFSYDRPARPPDGFISKPVDPDELVNTAVRLIG